MQIFTFDRLTSINHNGLTLMITPAKYTYTKSSECARAFRAIITQKLKEFTTKNSFHYFRSIFAWELRQILDFRRFIFFLVKEKNGLFFFCLPIEVFFFIRCVGCVRNFRLFAAKMNHSQKSFNKVDSSKRKQNNIQSWDERSLLLLLFETKQTYSLIYQILFDCMCIMLLLCLLNCECLCVCVCSLRQSTHSNISLIIHYRIYDD